MKKLRFGLISLLMAGALAVTAGAANYESSADKLKELDLFQGTSQGYELDRAPTRAEAATMLVRLLGKEAEAKTLTYSAPFTDLADWQKPYVQYLYENKLTTGTSATSFTPSAKCTAQMYTTFLLRSLGYSESAGDFTYVKAVDFGTEIGLVDYANCDQKNFLRDHVAAMSLTALNTAVKGEDTDLLDKLVADGAVDKTKTAGLQQFFADYDAYADAAAAMNASNKMDMSMDIKADVEANGQNMLTMSMPIRVKADMDLEHMDQSKMAMTGTMAMKLDPSMVEEGQSAQISEKISYYYTNGYYYMNMAGQKYKMPMSFDEIMEQLGDLSLMQSQKESLCLIDSIKKSGGKTVITYSSAGMSGMIDAVLGSMGMTDLGISVQMQDVASSVMLENGKMTQMNVTAAMTMAVEGETIGINMDMSAKINALGNSVSVTLPADLNTYVEFAGSMDGVE